jgi:hypothetical protein
MTRAALDGLAYSSILAGLVAGALVVSVTLALGHPIDAGLALLALAGTVAVYNVDRLRDRERDRALAPARTAFVERHAPALRALTGVALLVCVACSTRLGGHGFGICAAVLGLGLAHRRLKRLRGIKTAYLACSWLLVTVGLPALGRAQSPAVGAEALFWVVAIIGSAVTANLMASNLDRSRLASPPDPGARRRKLAISIATAGLGMAFALVGPESVRPLGAVAAAQFIALVRYREGEAYLARVVDGSLFAGAVTAIALLIHLRG